MQAMTKREAAAGARHAGSIGGTLVGAGKLTGAVVCDATGRKIGKVEDIVIDTRTGCVRYAVVALGGVLGVGVRRYAVQWNALTPDASGRRCMLNVAHLWLTGSPLAADSRWPDTVAAASEPAPSAVAPNVPPATQTARRIGPMWPSASFGKL